jgi:alanyl-tRNA synthetase
MHEILANASTQARVMDIESAQKTGAMMLFGEKYGETVRVLDIGSSRELCGGTHVTAHRRYWPVQSGVRERRGRGVRRIEAVTGANALAYVQSLERTVQEAAGSLRTPPAELNQRIHQVLDQVKGLEKELAALKGKVGFFARRRAVDAGGGRSKASSCWWPSSKALMPKPCATPWTSSKTSSKPRWWCWPASTATKCKSPPV